MPRKCEWFEPPDMLDPTDNGARCNTGKPAKYKNCAFPWILVCEDHKCRCPQLDESISSSLNIAPPMALKSPESCEHGNLCFGAGYYYIKCEDCNAKWVAGKSDGTLDRLRRGAGFGCSLEKRIKK